MASKVFIFEGGFALYCNNVTYNRSVWIGDVINGDWRMKYAENLKEIRNVNMSPLKRDLLWVGDPFGIANYNDVINDAVERYENGEPSNRELKKKVRIDDNDDIAF